MMTSRLNAVLIAVAGLVASAHAAQSQNAGKSPTAAPRVMKAAEIKQMLAGNTLSGTVKVPSGSDVHHDIFIDPDGTMRGLSRTAPPLSSEFKIAGAWSVERNQFCFHEMTAIVWSCPKFERRGENEVMISDATGRTNVIIRIIPGNPRKY